MYVSPATRIGRRRLAPIPWFDIARNKTTPNTVTPVYSIKVLDPGFVGGFIALVPKGFGGILGAIPDNGVIGGNVRGNYSVDLQFAPRTAANQIAGTLGAVLLGGLRNSIRSAGAGPTTYSAIVGGIDCYIDSSSGTAGLGSFIGGGVAVTLDQSGGSGARGSIGGNTIGFTGDTTGAGNVGGTNVTLSAPYVVNLGGQQATAGFDHSVMMGTYVKTRAINSFAIGPGNSSSIIGAAGFAIYPLAQTTSTASATELTTNSNATPGATNRAGGVFGTNEIASFTGLVNAKLNSSGDAAMWRLEGNISWVAGVITLNISTVTNVYTAAALAGVACTLSMDTANKQLQVNITGLAATTIQWSGYILLTSRQ